jgi:hypothetical protein
MRIDAHQHFWTHSAAEYPWIGPGMDRLARDFGPRRWDEIGEPVEELGDGNTPLTIRSSARETSPTCHWPT